MSRFDIPGSPLTMATLAPLLTGYYDALANSQRGSTAPSSPTEGTLWWDTSVAGKETLKRYTAANGWRSMVEMTTATGAIIPSVGADLPMGGFKATGLGAPSATTDAARRDTVGYERIQQQTVSSSVAAIQFTLPAGYKHFKVLCDGARLTTTGAQIGLRFSTNGGSTWLSSGYAYSYLATSISAVSAGVSTPTFIPLSTDARMSVASDAIYSDADLSPGVGSVATLTRFRSSNISDTNSALQILEGAATSASAINAVQVLVSTGSISAGTFTLMGVA